MPEWAILQLQVAELQRSELVLDSNLANVIPEAAMPSSEDPQRWLVSNQLRLIQMEEEEVLAMLKLQIVELEWRTNMLVLHSSLGHERQAPARLYLAAD